jgi:hypothetical protein
LAAWIEVGMASAHLGRLDLAACAEWLSRAEKHEVEPAAEVEIALVRAVLETERGDRPAARKCLDRADRRLADLAVTEALPLRARLHDLRAQHCTRPTLGDQVDIERARSWYANIPESEVPFVAFVRNVGLAYCAWKLGDAEVAATLAQRAVDAAGDGGLVRMRVMALNMWSRVLSGEAAVAVNDRARRMAIALEDEDLLRRVAASSPAVSLARESSLPLPHLPTR